MFAAYILKGFMYYLITVLRTENNRSIFRAAVSFVKNKSMLLIIFSAVNNKSNGIILWYFTGRTHFTDRISCLFKR